MKSLMMIVFLMLVCGVGWAEQVDCNKYSGLGWEMERSACRNANTLERAVNALERLAEK